MSNIHKQVKKKSEILNSNEIEIEFTETKDQNYSS